MRNGSILLTLRRNRKLRDDHHGKRFKESAIAFTHSKPSGTVSGHDFDRAVIGTP